VEAEHIEAFGSLIREQNRMFASTLAALAEQVQQLKAVQPYPWMLEPLPRFKRLMKALDAAGDDPASALLIGDPDESVDEAVSTDGTNEPPTTSPSG